MLTAQWVYSAADITRTACQFRSTQGGRSFAGGLHLAEPDGRCVGILAWMSLLICSLLSVVMHTAQTEPSGPILVQLRETVYLPRAGVVKVATCRQLHLDRRDRT